MRINKFLAEAGVCSRRGADALVEQGVVAVNGVRVTEMGTQVDETRDRVTVRGKPVRVAAAPSVCIMLNKPVRVVSTASDPQGRRTVLDCLPPALKNGRRLYPVGRLDFFSEGLLLITDDGELTSRLIHPRYHVPKMYRVTVRGVVNDKVLGVMRGGMTLAEGEKLAPVAVRVVRPEGDAYLLEMVLNQGVNRQIRRMCRDLDLTVLRLVRVAQGPLSLGSLAPGAARVLTDAELTALRRAAGMV